MSGNESNASQQTKDGRTRTWALILYPDSVPDNWKEIIADEMVPAFVSPLHDKDVNADGTAKKPHWHVLLMYSGKKSRKQMEELAGKLNAPRPQPVSDKRGYARYLCHVDNPEKYQYSRDDILSFSGADYLTYLEGASDIDTAVGEMMDWLDEQGIYSFAALSRYARRNKPDWFRVLTSSRSYFLSQYCKSKQWEINQGISGE